MNNDHASFVLDLHERIKKIEAREAERLARGGSRSEERQRNVERFRSIVLTKYIDDKKPKPVTSYLAKKRKGGRG